MSNEFNYLTRKIVMYADLNGAGTLFGGRALSWIDEEAAIFATTKICEAQLAKNIKTTPLIVTAHMSEISFLSPAFKNDIIEIGCKLVKIGRTSITVSVNMRNGTTGQDILHVANIVFVNLDENRKPYPIISES